MDNQVIDAETLSLEFCVVRANKTYCPLKLKCRAVGEEKKGGSTTKKVVGASHSKYKCFKDKGWYDLYCMYGRDIFEERCLFCKQIATKDSDVYKIVRGFFLFEFAADEYFSLLCNASRYNWMCFAANTVASDKNEVLRFQEMVNGSDIPEKKKNLAAQLIDRLLLSFCDE